VNNVLASFNVITGQMTETPQRKKNMRSFLLDAVGATFAISAKISGAPDHRSLQRSDVDCPVIIRDGDVTTDMLFHFAFDRCQKISAVYGKKHLNKILSYDFSASRKESGTKKNVFKKELEKTCLLRR